MARDATARKTIGNRLAPPAFILFVVFLVVGASCGNLLWGWRIGTMAGFDFAAAFFLLYLIPKVHASDARSMRDHASQNDANRVLLLGVTAIVMVVVLVTIAAELSTSKQAGMTTKVLIVSTLVLAWLFSNTVYALHYAHLYYSNATDGKGDAGGLDFGGDTKEPLYWDFVYFAFTLGMTFQTSDTSISSPRLRKIAVIHSFAAFVFNIGVLAFTINVLGGSS
ncbi:MAG: hypothetical protein JWO25_862 [Alphaproteobacteria bacterium]|nr:hypothetical protein [Alphaproteobacteria bacterium]